MPTASTAPCCCPTCRARRKQEPTRKRPAPSSPAHAAFYRQKKNHHQKNNHRHQPPHSCLARSRAAKPGSCRQLTPGCAAAEGCGIKPQQARGICTLFFFWEQTSASRRGRRARASLRGTSPVLELLQRTLCFGSFFESPPKKLAIRCELSLAWLVENRGRNGRKKNNNNKTNHPAAARGGQAGQQELIFTTESCCTLGGETLEIKCLRVYAETLKKKKLERKMLA